MRDPAARDRTRRRVVGAVAVAVVVVGLAAATAGVAASLRPDAEVAVGAPPERVEDDAPRPVTCAPAPCERWRADLGPGAVTVAGDTIVYVDGNRVAVLDEATGDERWEQQRHRPPGSRELGDDALAHVVGDVVIVVDAPSGAVVGHDLDDGRRRWTAIGDLGMWLAEVSVTDDLLVARWHDAVGRGELRGLDLTDGVARWAVTFDAGVGATGPDVRGSEHPPVVALDDRVVGLDPATGEVRWELEHDGEVVTDRGFALLTSGGRPAGVVDATTGTTIVEGTPISEGPSDTTVRVVARDLLVTTTGGTHEVRGPRTADHVALPHGDVVGVAGGSGWGAVALRRIDEVVVVGLRPDGTVAWDATVESAQGTVWRLVARGEDTVELTGRTATAVEHHRFVGPSGALRLGPGDSLGGRSLDPTYDDGERWLVPRRGGAAVGASDGAIVLDGHAEMVHPSDPLLVRTADGLHALDERVLER